MLTYLQEKLLFKSETLPLNHVFNFSLSWKEFYLKGRGNGKIHGLHFKPDVATDSLLLYFHGNAGNLNTWGYWGEHLANTYSVEVVLIDYRGYGKSSGTRSYDFMLDDAHRAWSYCTQFAKPENITVFGRSMGGAFASSVAREHNPRKLILESTFTQIKKVAQDKYWFLPIEIFLKYHFQNAEHLPHIVNDTHIIHGTHDKLVTFDQGKQLYELSGASIKELHRIEQGAHNDLHHLNDYKSALDSILIG